jgi:SAM-dependent methyltransferase
MSDIKDKAMFPGTAMPDADWWTQLWPHPDQVLEQLGIKPGMSAVDLCCGNGYFTIPLAKAVVGNVYGIDLNEALLQEAKNVAERTHVTIRWICGDAMELETLLPEKVDFVLMANTFHGVQDQAALVQSVAKALKEHGVFAVINWHSLPREQTTVLDKPRGPKTEMRISPDRLRATIEPLGFTEKRFLELPPYHYGAIFQKQEKR